MILLFTILFKIIPPEKNQNTKTQVSNHMKIIKSNKYNCDSNNGVSFIGGVNFTSDALDLDAFFYCDNKVSPVFNMINCLYYNVHGSGFGLIKKYRPDYIIHLLNINSYLYNNNITDCTSKNSLIKCENSIAGNYFNMSSNIIKDCLHNKNHNADYLINIYNLNTELYNNSISNCIIYNTLISFDHNMEKISFHMSSNIITDCRYNANQKAKYILHLKNGDSYLYNNIISNCIIYESIISFENSKDDIDFQMSSNTISNCIHHSAVNGNFIIYMTKSKSFLYNNTISDCASYSSIIKYDNENEGTYFNMSLNVITNCYHPEDKSETIVTNSYNNDFQNNLIKYDTDTSKAGRAFSISYNSGCFLINNIVENAFHKDGSALILQYQHQKDKPSVIKDCQFINCNGDNNSAGKKGGLIMIIENLDYDIEIINVTFKDTNPNNIEDKDSKRDNSFLIRIETGLDISPIVKFTYCHFYNLRNCEKCRAGGIGLVYKNNKKTDKTVIFDHSTFELIQNNNPDYGGGCMSIHTMDETKNTKLILIGCNFTDIKSIANGGAICFNSPANELTVEDCIFKQTETTKDNQNGGAIYTQAQNTYKPIRITNCHFENTKSSQGGAIYITRAENSNSEITIDSCNFENTHSTNIGNSIVISKTNTDQVVINNCSFVDCGYGRISFIINLDVSKLKFNYNKFSFSNSEKNCGCIHLEQISDHEYIGNTFSDAQINDEIEKSAGINFDNLINPNSIRIENNTFDNIFGQYKGRCFFLKLQTSSPLSMLNNTFQNCKTGGPLFGISFASTETKFVLESIQFIQNSISNSYDSTMGNTPQFIVENPINSSDYPDALELIIRNCLFNNNYNQNKGGALTYSLCNMMSNTKIHLDNCKFIENGAENGDGALSIHSYLGMECEECDFIDNKVLDGESIISIETNFESKKSDQTLISPPPSTNPHIIFRDCNFKNEKSNNNEIYINSCPNTPVQIYKCNFIDSINKGYAIYINDNKIDEVNINNCSFVFSNQEKSAAAIFTKRDKINLIGNTFQKCNKETIQIECQDLEKNSIHLIENNFIDCFMAPIINLHYSITNEPIIEGNIFDNVVVNDFIFEFVLKESVDSITFKNNTFKNFVQKSEIKGIGFKIENENQNSDLRLIFENCYFMNNQNAGAINCDSNQNRGKTYITLKECYFVENKHSNQGGAIFINTKNDIVIDTCNFISNSAEKGSSIFIDTDFLGDSKKATIVITNCNFNQNTPINDGSSSIYISPGSTKTLKIESCNFKEENGGVQINDFNNNINIESNSFYDVKNGPSLYITESSTSTIITIDTCVFDSCKGNDNKCFYLLTETQQLNFQNCVLQNLVGTGVNSYFGTFDVKDQRPYYLINISFINNVCDSLYGGGSGIKFIEFGSLFITDCKFINNTAKQNKSASRPSKNGKDYYNGDGGAIQLGYFCKIYDMDVQFSECIFKNNRAQRHGGAIAAQIYHGLSITKCSFENNIANFDSSSLSLNLLYNDYYDLKNAGRGGAIYINPAFSYDSTSDCPETNVHTSTVDISECTFNSNTAYDGYAFYFEGDDAETFFIIQKNIFSDNYNESNYNHDSNIIYGAVIATEICTLQKDQIEKDNTFNYSIENIKINNISCVDHYGNTPTQIFSRSNDFTSSQKFTYSHEFSKTNPFTKSQTFSSSRTFTQSEKFTQSSIFRQSETFAPSYTFSSIQLSYEPDISTISSDITVSDFSTDTTESNSISDTTESGSSSDTTESDSSIGATESDSSSIIPDSDSSSDTKESDYSTETIESVLSSDTTGSDSSSDLTGSDSSSYTIVQDSSTDTTESRSSSDIESDISTDSTEESSTTSAPSEEPLTNLDHYAWQFKMEKI